MTSGGFFVADVDLNTGSDHLTTPARAATAALAPVAGSYAIVRGKSWSDAHVSYSPTRYYVN